MILIKLFQSRAPHISIAYTVKRIYLYTVKVIGRGEILNESWIVWRMIYGRRKHSDMVDRYKCKKTLRRPPTNGRKARIMRKIILHNEKTKRNDYQICSSMPSTKYTISSTPLAALWQIVEILDVVVGRSKNTLLIDVTSAGLLVRPWFVMRLTRCSFVYTVIIDFEKVQHLCGFIYT